MGERQAPTVVVLGSVHMDLIATADRLPGRGESVGGGVFTMAPGGKGGNQACQFVLAGARAHMVTRLGADAFGRELLGGLQAKGVDTALVALDPDHPTGASTVLAAEGDYSSIIAPGAAALLSAEDVERARPIMERADALILQLELPVAVSAMAAEIAAAGGKRVILNASPAPDSAEAIPEALWRATSVLAVNRVEAGRLLGRPVDGGPAEVDVVDLAQRLGIETVVMTLGTDGVVAVQGSAAVHQPAFPAEVVDAVGAGDAFLGVFVTALLKGLSLAEALRRGAAAGALAVSRRGVYAALPTRAEVDRLLASLGV